MSAYGNGPPIRAGNNVFDPRYDNPEPEPLDWAKVGYYMASLTCLLFIVTGALCIVSVHNRFELARAVGPRNDDGVPTLDFIQTGGPIRTNVTNQEFTLAAIASMLICWAAVGLAVENEYSFMWKYFDVLSTLVGRGVFYLFMGTAAMGLAGDLGMLSGIFSLFVGATLISRVCCCGSEPEENWDVAAGGTTSLGRSGPMVVDASGTQPAHSGPVVEDRVNKPRKSGSFFRAVSGRFAADFMKRKSHHAPPPNSGNHAGAHGTGGGGRGGRGGSSRPGRGGGRGRGARSNRGR